VPRPGRFTPNKTRHTLYRRLGGPQDRSWRVQKISPAPEFDPRTVEPVVSRYTDWTIPAHRGKTNIWKNASLLSTNFKLLIQIKRNSETLINVVITLEFVIFISGGFCNSSPRALLDVDTPLDERVLGYETCFRFLLNLQPKICNKQSVRLYRVGLNCRLLCYGTGMGGLLRTTSRHAHQPYTITIHCLNQKKLYLVQTTK